MDGVGANGFVVLAASGEGAPGLWLVPADAQGVSIKPMSMIDSRNMARVQFDKVELSADMALVARPAAQVLDEVLDRARPAWPQSLWACCVRCLIVRLAI
jgi:hypothetical protein